LEINPLVCLDAAPGKPAEIYYMDMAAKLDQTADFLCGPKWAIARDMAISHVGSATIKADRGPPMVWPAPFGRDLTKEEAYIQKLDASTGASLKLTVLNQAGRVWTMVAGGESHNAVRHNPWLIPKVALLLSTLMQSLPLDLLTNLPTTVNTPEHPPRARPSSTPRP